MKAFHGCIFIDKNDLEKVGINHPMKVDYYKINDNSEQSKKYGIEIVKTQYLKDNIDIETECIENITNDEAKVNGILNLLKEHQVTPVTAKDVIQDLMYN